MSFAFFISCFELNSCKKKKVNSFQFVTLNHSWNKTKVSGPVSLMSPATSKEHRLTDLAYCRLSQCGTLYFSSQIVTAPPLGELNFPISLTWGLAVWLALASEMWAEVILSGTFKSQCVALPALAFLYWDLWVPSWGYPSKINRLRRRARATL